jgi:hypothetical protein
VVRRPLEDACAEVALEGADRDRQRRLYEMDAAGRSREGALLGDREEVLQLPELHDGDAISS